MSPLSLTYNSPIEFVVLATVVISSGVIALSVYRTNPKSATHQIFALLTLFTMLWLFITYIVRVPELARYTLLFHRLGIFFAAPMSFMFFLLGHTMPSSELQLSKRWQLVAAGATVLMMLANISPYAFTASVVETGIMEPKAGPGLIPFAVISTIFSILAVYFLIRSYLRRVGDEKKQVGLILSGILLMLGLIIVTILLPVILFHSLAFLPFAPLYVLVFLGLTAYAITRYQLFNIKILLTQSLIIIINVVLAAKLFGDTDPAERVLDLLILLFMILFGSFLIRSVRNEVRQRELIETQEKELEVSNARLRELDQQKSEFLSFASHQLRTPITAIKWNLSAMDDGTYGEIPKHLDDPLEIIRTQATNMAVMIDDYLNVSRIEQGRIKYQFAPVDLLALMQSVGAEMQPGIENRGLTLTSNLGTEKISVWGDAGKLTQIFSNVVDNAMKYTQKGGITLVLAKDAKKNLAHVEIRDTGIGMDEATRNKIFEKFARGDAAQAVNSGGSGLGLFIVKTFIEAHKGTIRPESLGVGKGTTFIIELPLLVQSGQNPTTITEKV